jgi:hypothetical protein
MLKISGYKIDNTYITDWSDRLWLRDVCGMIQRRTVETS